MSTTVQRDLLIEAPSLVSVRGVDVRYPGADRPALVGADLEVRAGARVALTGRSGSGKSTLLHVLAGLVRPERGTVEWSETVNPMQSAGRTAVVFQAPSLLLPLTVVENVELPLLIGDGSPEQARATAMEALETLGLAFLADRLPEELSGGQAQRVAVARVLATAPSLILADEPTGQLDSATADAVVDSLLASAAAHAAALVVATHDPRVWRRLAQRHEIVDGTVGPIVNVVAA